MVQWSKVSGAAGRVTDQRNGDTVAVPTGLRSPETYLICSEVSYTYMPTIGYVMAKAGITLERITYTRPRQSTA